MADQQQGMDPGYAQPDGPREGDHPMYVYAQQGEGPVVRRSTFSGAWQGAENVVRRSKFSDALANIAGGIDMLDETLETLFGAITPVLGLMEPQQEEAKPVREPMAPFVEAIYAQVDRIEELRRSVLRVIDRVEL